MFPIRLLYYNQHPQGPTHRLVYSASHIYARACTVIIHPYHHRFTSIGLIPLLIIAKTKRAVSNNSNGFIDTFPSSNYFLVISVQGFTIKTSFTLTSIRYGFSQTIHWHQKTNRFLSVSIIAHPE